MALVGGGGKGITESIGEIVSAFFSQLLINQIVLWDMHVPLRSELDLEYGVVYSTCCFFSGNKGSRISMYEHMCVPRTDLQIAYDTERSFEFSLRRIPTSLTCFYDSHSKAY